MAYFKVNTQEHYDMYDGPKAIVNGEFLIEPGAKKTLERRLAYLSAKVAAASAKEESELQYQKQIDWWNSKLESMKVTAKEYDDGNKALL